MATVKVTQKRNGTTEITISGELDIYSAMEMYQQHFQSITLKELVTFKLRGITEIDTAGMQILIMLFKDIIQQNANYVIDSLSETVIEYSQLFNLQQYFHNQDHENIGGK